MTVALLVVAASWLAWSNGANDNFKGVATLYGSGTASYKRALGWATTTTFVGSLVSVVLASKLIKAFSGHGLVPDALIGPRLLVAVGLAGAATILLATVLGMPTSTTHALTGALVGVALVGAGVSGVDWHILATKFAQPLLLSPLLAVGVTMLLYPLAHRCRCSLGVRQIGLACCQPPPQTGNDADERTEQPDAATLERYEGAVLAMDAQRAVDTVHYASAGAVCFARAVNDTPKIAALLLAAQGVGHVFGLVVVAVAMAIGGLVQSRKVAETMSNHITDLNPGQGLLANLATSGLVLGASRLGVPVSTTHVSCGAIFGIGLSTGKRNWKTIGQILVTWVTTLPLGLILGALLYGLLGPLG